MRKMTLASAMLCGMAVYCVCAVPAQAQNNKSWVASSVSVPPGDDVNLCTRAAPCATLARALTQTNAGGEIGFVDSGEYAAVNITKSVKIVAEGVDATIVQTSPGSAAVFVSPAASTDVVSLQGLVIDGVGFGGIGVIWSTGAALEIKNCVIRNFNSAAPRGFGISVTKNSPSRLVVTDTIVANNGNGSTGAGIQISPTAGGSAAVVLDRVTVVDNVYGISVDGSNSTAGINMSIANSTVHGNSQNGILAFTPAGGAPMGLMVKSTRVVNNNLGIRSTGAGITVRVSNSTLTGNGTALTFNNSGALLSFGNNEVEGNGANGTFSGLVTLK